MYDRFYLFQDIDFSSPPSITLVIAETGYGKTEAVKQLVDHFELPFVWNSLDQWSIHKHQLIDQTIQLLGDKYHRVAENKPTGNSPREIAQLLKSHGAPLIYVFDNCHYLNLSQESLEWLSEFARETHQFCYFVFVGHEEPEFSLIDVFSTQDILIRGKLQLRLNADDVERLATQYKVNKEFVQQLIELNDGKFSEIRPWLEEQQPLDNLNLESYIHTVIDSLEQPTRDLLFLSAIPFKFTLQQLNDLSDADDVESTWSQLRQTNLSIERIHGSNNYQYNEQTRQIILSSLRESSQERYQILNKVYADWLNDHGEYNSAIYHYLQADHTDSAIRAMNYVIDHYRQQGLSDILLNLQNLFQHYQICIPELHLACVKFLMTNLKFAEAEAAIQYVYDSIDDISPLLEVQLQTRSAYIAIRRGDYDGSIATLEAIQHEIEPDTPNSKLAVALIQLVLGQAYLETAKYDLAEQPLLIARDLYADLNSQIDHANALQDLALLYARSGQLEMSGEYLLKMLKIREELNDIGGLAAACNNIGSYYIQIHDYDNGELYFHRGLEYCEKINGRRIQGYLNWNLGDYYRDLQQSESALDYYNKALQVISHKDFIVHCGILSSLATLYRHTEQRQNAIDCLNLLNRIAKRIDSDLYQNIAELHIMLLSTTAKVDEIHRLFITIHESGNQIETIRLLGPVLQFALTSSPTLVDYVMDIYNELKDMNQSMQPLVVHITNSLILRNFFDKELQDDIMEEVQLLDQRQDKLVFQRLRNTSRSDLVHVTLDIKTFNLERMTIDGNTLPYDDLPSLLQRELFYWLYFEGPKRLHQITEKYWGNFTDKNANASFRITKYRLHKTMGEVIVLQDNMYQISDAYTITSDALLFEETVSKAKLGSYSDIRTEDLWSQALDLYDHEFLVLFDRDWIIYRRDTYQQYYIDALVGLSQCALRRLDSSAIAYAQWAIRENKLDESLYRHLMTVYANFGQKSKVVDTYESLTEVLMVELGISPSETTNSLYSSLVGDR